MSTKLRILSIDDNHQNLSLLQQALEDRFDVISSPGDEPIVELVQDCEPDIILLDIMLNEVNGYDVCQQIRQMTHDKKLVVIFISSLQSLEDKLKAYEVGGDDYICKPVNIDELVYKLESYETLINQQQDLVQQMEEASQAAIASMLHTNELSVMFEFFSHSLSINDFDSLYLATDAVLRKFKLGCAIEYRTKHSKLQYPKKGINQLESEILDLGKRAKRIVTFGKNVLFNSKHCSLLVKRLDADDETIGRLKDHLVIFLDIIDGRIIAIEESENKVANKQLLVDAIKRELSHSGAQFNQKLYQMEMSLETIFSQLEERIEQSSRYNQGKIPQNEIRNIVSSAKQQIEHSIEQAADFNNHSPEIEQLLKQLL